VGELSTSVEAACRWRRRKEERPAEIVSAALEVFTDKGFALCKLDEVAKRAGISKGTLYLYFENKEALFKAVVNKFVLPQIEQAEEKAALHKGSKQVLLRELTEQWRLNILETGLSGIPKIMISEASNFPELATFYLENVIKRVRSFISQLITQGVAEGEFRQCDGELAARAFLAPLVFAAIWEHSLAPFDDDYDRNAYINTQLDIFIHGIMKGKQE